MRNLLVPSTALFAVLTFSLLGPTGAGAVTYSDLPSDRPTAISIRVLTDLGTVQGYSNGMFKPGQLVNRAEFMKVVFGLPLQTRPITMASCFPDVPANTWYTPYVCQGKSMGLVSGHNETLPPEQRLFKPADPVRYPEALKILLNLMEIESDPFEAGPWYNRYMRAAEDLNIDLPNAQAGQRLTRGEVAWLVLAFVSYDRGQLDLLSRTLNGDEAAYGQLLAALRSQNSSSSTSSMSSSSSVSSQSSSASSTSSMSSSMSSGGITDPLTDNAPRAQFLLLGETSPMLGAVRVFEGAEPLLVTRISVTLDAAATAVDAIRVYDENRRFLGLASRDPADTTNRRYSVNIPTGTFRMEKADEVSIYARAVLKTHDQGGTSGQNVRVGSFTVEGTGEWSNSQYIKSSSDIFNDFQTARATITAIENAGPVTGILTSGTNQLLGSFRIRARETDPSAEARITQIRFQIEATSGVTLTNVRLTADGADTSMSCSIASSIATCTGIDPQYGSLNTGERTLRVYGDVSLDSSIGSNRSLRLTINEGGSYSSAGAITWTDGTSTFTWVPFSNPIAHGTEFKI